MALRIVFAVVFLPTLFLESAGAASVKQVKAWCINDNDTFSADLQIKGCSSIINSGVHDRGILSAAYVGRGLGYLKKHDFDRAIASYNEAMRLNSKDGDIYAKRGQAYAEKRNYDRAIADYNVALRLNPNDVMTYIGRGSVYDKKRQYDDAIEDYLHASRITPNAVSFYFACDDRIMLGQLQQAIANCNDALRLEPKFPLAHEARGIAYLRTGAFERASADFDEAIHLQTGMAGSFYGRGIAKLKKGDAAGGNADIAAAKALRVNIVEEYARYGLTVPR